MSTFKPMLSGKADLAALQFPLLASRKLDGIRAVIRDGRVLSRTLKEISPSFKLQLSHAGFVQSLLDSLTVDQCADTICRALGAAEGK